MPTYVCRSPVGLLNHDIRMSLAEAITRIHEEVTGGERFFVQVIFRDLALDDCFIGGRVLDAAHIFIQGHIRAGRSAVERAALIRKLLPTTSDILGVPRNAVWIYLSELPARAMAEFGHILPEPGDEENWLAQLPAEDRRRLERL
jgi:phenylpyruvate tautomerase PptA (4-oxalocrotonate tautomerase family)